MEPVYQGTYITRTLSAVFCSGTGTLGRKRQRLPQASDEAVTKGVMSTAEPSWTIPRVNVGI